MRVCITTYVIMYVASYVVFPHNKTGDIHQAFLFYIKRHKKLCVNIGYPYDRKEKYMQEDEYNYIVILTTL